MGILFENSEYVFATTATRKPFDDFLDEICQRERKHGFTRKVTIVGDELSNDTTVTLTPYTHRGPLYGYSRHERGCEPQGQAVVPVEVNGSYIAVFTKPLPWLRGLNEVSRDVVAPNVTRVVAFRYGEQAVVYALHVTINNEVDLCIACSRTPGVDVVRTTVAIHTQREYMGVEPASSARILEMVNDNTLRHLIDLNNVASFSVDVKNALALLVGEAECRRLTKPLVIVDGARAYRQSLTSQLPTRCKVVGGHDAVAVEIAEMLGNQILSDDRLATMKSNPTLVCSDIDGLGTVVYDVEFYTIVAVFVDTGYPNVPLLDESMFMYGASKTDANNLLSNRRERLIEIAEKRMRTIKTISS